MRQFFWSLFIFLIVTPCLAFKLPSSVSVFQSFDNDKNRNTALDFTLGTPIMAVVHGGVSHSQLQYDEDIDGSNTSAHIGVESNPLRDWVFGANYQHIFVSDQMTIFDPSVNVKRYFKHFDLKLDVGFRTIQTDLTESIQNLFNLDKSQVKDENFWWSLAANFNLGEKLVVGASYHQYQYSTRFQFFNTSFAQPFGYNLDTITYGASFPDYIVSAHANVYQKRWEFGLEYQFIKNEFDDTNTTTWIPSAGFYLNRKWFFNLSLGLSRGVTTDEEDTSGGFLGLGTTYTF